MSNYRVLKRKPGVPVAALQLQQDVDRLGMIYDLLGRIDPEDIVKERTEGDRFLREMKVTVRNWLKFAENRLRSEYLAP